MASDGLGWPLMTTDDVCFECKSVRPNLDRSRRSRSLERRRWPCDQPGDHPRGPAARPQRQWHSFTYACCGSGTRRADHTGRVSTLVLGTQVLTTAPSSSPQVRARLPPARRARLRHASAHHGALLFPTGTRRAARTGRFSAPMERGVAAFVHAAHLSLHGRRAARGDCHP